MAIYGYKLTQGRANAIQNASFAKAQYFNPVQDINGEWFVFEEEKQEIEKLFTWGSELVRAEFIPPPPVMFDAETEEPKKPK